MKILCLVSVFVISLFLEISGGIIQASEFCGTSTKEQCGASSDCIISGCFQSVCKLKNLNTTAMPSISDCLWNTCYDHKALNYECGCFSDQCQWNALPTQIIIPPEVIIPPATTIPTIAPTSAPAVVETTTIPTPLATSTATTTVANTDFLKSEIARLTALIQTLTAQLLALQPVKMGGLTVNMGYGGRGYQVKTLQIWLSRDKSIYPEGLITGYFGRLTLLAVKRFQTKYASEVLTPRGRTVPDGIVEKYARLKLNSIFAK